ncbi:MAG TPA: DNA repair protein RadA [Clostridiales bacterium]|nr:DNA repair protein RadA [Clostridiales bacterium]
MGSKTKSVYICSECGFESPRWAGRCSSCGAWNTLHEEVISTEKSMPAPSKAINIQARPIREISVTEEFRYVTGISELDRVLGGGIVKGSVVLLCGDPGIGKSTILLQICGRLSGCNILYVSGEESARQLKLRADRLGIDNRNLFVMAETDALGIAEYIRTCKPDLIMIDSIQTMNLTDLNSSPGSVTQVRECTNLFLRIGKALEIPVIIVGHVNKDGAIAGPKVMEHIVDAVLYFEGERNNSYRILRAIKNRFGSTNEIGVFEMTDAGLREVVNPSLALLSGRMKNVSGTCVACVLEGSRTLLAEVQGLVTTTGFGTPRRMATGFDYNRLNLLLAVLEKRMGFLFSNLDTYLNVVGGIRLDEPAADLPVVLSLVSTLKDIPIPEDLAAFGEIGLSGEIRSAPRAQARINEAERLGFKRCIIPYSCVKQLNLKNTSINFIGVRNIQEAVRAVF